MSIYATIGESEPAFFSSTQGWMDVVKWADGLSEETFVDVVHLVDHGFTDCATTLAEQMQAALKSDPPSVEVAATISELLELLNGESGEVIINSGMEE